MLAGISLTCFTASYVVALALEGTRLWFRSGMRGAVLLGFSVAGVFAHTSYLAHRAVTAEGTPLSSEFDWYLVAAWALAALYLTMTIGQLRAPVERRTAIGLFLLPLVLGLVAAAYFLAGRESLTRDAAYGVWLQIHFACLVAGFVSVLVGFATGVMELVQAHRLKHKLPPPRGLRLPSLEWLETNGVRSVYASFLLLLLGLLSGVILNGVRGQFSWTDPVVWRFVGVVVWQTAVTAFLTFYKPARQGRKVAYITIASFVITVVSLGIGRLLPSEHGAPKKAQVNVEHGAIVGVVVQRTEGRRDGATEGESDAARVTESKFPEVVGLAEGRRGGEAEGLRDGAAESEGLLETRQFFTGREFTRRRTLWHFELVDVGVPPLRGSEDILDANQSRGFRPWLLQLRPFGAPNRPMPAEGSFPSVAPSLRLSVSNVSAGGAEGAFA
jgi:ABC-type uncharacterized transport system permease subunit